MTVIECAVVTLMAMAFVVSVFLLRALEKLCVKLAKAFDEQQAINEDFDKRLRGHWANIVELRAAVSKGTGDVTTKALREFMTDIEVKEGDKNGE